MRNVANPRRPSDEIPLDWPLPYARRVAVIPVPPACDVDSLRKLLATGAGELSKVPFYRLLLAAAVLERSLVIELRRNAIHKRIIIEEGTPVDSRSNIATESLGRYLVAQGRLSEPQFRLALSESVARNLSLEEVLVEKQLLPAGDVFRLLQQNLGRKLLDAFAWQNGTYQISGSPPRVESPLRVRVPQLILTGLLRFEPQERVERLFASIADQAVAFTEGGPFSLSELRLSAEQKSLVLALEGTGKWLNDLRGGQAGGEESQRLLYALFTLGLVEFVEAPGMRRATPPAVATVVSQPPATAAEPAGAPLLDKDELIAAYLSYRRKDALELFDLPETAGIVQINRSWVDFARRFAPWQFSSDGDALPEKAQEIFLAGTRAYAELADPDRRAAVIARRKAADAGAQAPGRSDQTERETLVDPEELYRRGRELAATGKTREALGYFEMASDCDPQNGTYAAELAWSRFELMITTAALAMKALKNALRIDPRSGAANLYIGRIHSTLGNHLEAEGYVLKAAELMPRDPRVAEALRLVRNRGKGLKS